MKFSQPPTTRHEKKKRKLAPNKKIFVEWGESIYSLHSLPHLADGGLSYFSERLYRRHLGQIGILGGNCHFRWGWFFFRWDLKTPCIKNSEYKSQVKKNSSDWNFYNFSLLVPYTNKFLYLYPYFPWHILSLTPQIFFFVRG